MDQNVAKIMVLVGCIVVVLLLGTVYCAVEDPSAQTKVEQDTSQGAVTGTDPKSTEQLIQNLQREMELIQYAVQGITTKIQELQGRAQEYVQIYQGLKTKVEEMQKQLQPKK